LSIGWHRSDGMAEAVIIIIPFISLAAVIFLVNIARKGHRGENQQCNTICYPFHGALLGIQSAARGTRAAIDDYR
jgi:hypothetical protein